MKKVKVILIIIVFTMINTQNVHALEDNILEIVLPSNAFTPLDCENNLTERDKIIISVFKENHAIINEKGKEIIAIMDNSEKETSYQVLPDITEEDRTIDLTPDLIYYASHTLQKREVNYRGSSSNITEYPIHYNQLFEEAVKGYTKLRFSVQNKECKRITEKVIYDFKKIPDMLSLSTSSNEILSRLVFAIDKSQNSYPIATRSNTAKNFEIVNNANGTLLFTANVEEENSKIEFRLAPNLSYLDNFTIELKEEDFLVYGDHIIKEIEFRFGEEPIPETPKDVVIETPNTSEKLSAFLYLGSSILIILGSIAIILVTAKKKKNSN